MAQPTATTRLNAHGHALEHSFHYDVKAQYGAVGDGVVDDASAVQAAIDAAVTAGGGAVYFPEGTYLCNSTLTINADSVSLSGANKAGSQIRFGNLVNPGLDLGDDVTQRHYITIQNLTLTRGTAGGGPILRGRKIDQCIFRDSQFAGGTNTLDFDQLLSSSITNCGIASSTLMGLDITNSDQVQVIGNYFEDADASTDPHLNLGTGNKNISVVGNNFSTATKAIQIGVGTNTDHAIVGNTVENCLHGFDLDAGGVGLTRSVVVGNSLRGDGAGGGLGIIVSAANTDLAIVGNLVTNYAGGLFSGTPGSNVQVIANPGIASIGAQVNNLEIDGALNHDGTTVGFYGTAPTTQQTGVAVTAAAIHAALVNLGLITA